MEKNATHLILFFLISASAFAILLFVFLAKPFAEQEQVSDNQTFKQIYHFECINFSCKAVSGEGENYPNCTKVGEECGINHTHFECINYSCVLVEGKGENGSCTYKGEECGPHHLECINLRCVLVVGNGTNYSGCLSEGKACNDMDEDGVSNDEDNCMNVSNTNQTDRDGDGLGDACDVCPLDINNDEDKDGVCGDVDNCPDIYNPEQEDSDKDGIGNYCDPTPVNCEWACKSSIYNIYLGTNIDDTECTERAQEKIKEKECKQTCAYIVQRPFKYGSNEQYCCCMHLHYYDCEENCSVCPDCPEFPEPE